MTDLTPLRKPLVLAVIAAFSVGMAYAPGPDADKATGLAALAFFLYLILGD